MFNNDLGNLYIISAPSGGGKTSLVRALIQSLQKICVSISYTTRSPRSKEIEGRSYHFIKEAQFQDLIAQEAFLEYAKVFGYYYGTSLSWVQEKLHQGIDVILIIDWQGQRAIKQKIPSMISIFLLPPSLAALETRLLQRGQDSLEVISKRMQQAKIEISHYREYDYLVVNNNFAKALKSLQAIICSHRLKQNRQVQSLHSLLKTLL